MKVYIIGIGPGRGDYLLPIAKREIEKADCLVGAKRLLSLFQNLGKEEVVIDGHFDKIIPYIKRYKDKKRIAVLVSGDPGMYSLLERISQVLKSADYAVIPGISTVQLAFSRIGKSWYDAMILSLHGRRIDNLAAQIRNCAKVFLFTGPDFPPDVIARHLLKEGIENRRAVILENLSYPNERIIETDLKRLSKMRGFGLSTLIIELYKRKITKGKLYGIGLGPGDPRLITLRAREVLEKVDTIFVPKANEDGASCAQTIVEAVTSNKKSFVELTFPMTKDKSILNKYWLSAAKRIAQEVNKKRVVAFVTIGDPLIYSTYIYLLKTLQKKFPDIEVKTIPGIAAFNAAASAINLPLVEGDERLAILPVRKDLKGLREVIKEFQTIVLMKVGSKLDRVIWLLKELGLVRKAILISHLGYKNQRIFYSLASLKDKKAGYLSVILIRKD